MAYEIKATRKGHRIVALLIKQFPNLRYNLLTDEFEIWDGILTTKPKGAPDSDKPITGVCVRFQKAMDAVVGPLYISTFEQEGEKDTVSYVGQYKSNWTEIIGEDDQHHFEPKQMVFKQTWVDSLYPKAYKKRGW